MDELYAAIGRQQMAIRAKDAAFDALLKFVAELVDGSIDPARVLVNLTDRTVSRTPEGEYATLPPQINGLPVCVIAPAIHPTWPPTAPPRRRMRETFTCAKCGAMTPSVGPGADLNTKEWRPKLEEVLTDKAVRTSIGNIPVPTETGGEG